MVAACFVYRSEASAVSFFRSFVDSHHLQVSGEAGAAESVDESPTFNDQRAGKKKHTSNSLLQPCMICAALTTYTLRRALSCQVKIMGYFSASHQSSTCPLRGRKEQRIHE
jgi:hypothetical protein